jgi:hypothetical protein
MFCFRATSKHNLTPNTGQGWALIKQSINVTLPQINQRLERKAKNVHDKWSTTHYFGGGGLLLLWKQWNPVGIMVYRQYIKLSRNVRKKEVKTKGSKNTVRLMTVSAWIYVRDQAEGGGMVRYIRATYMKSVV